MTFLKHVCYNAANFHKIRVLAVLLLTVALFFFFSDFDSLPEFKIVRSLSRFVFDYSSSDSPIKPSVVTVDKFYRASRSNLDNMIREITSCDLYDGSWVFDKDSVPLYETGSCPYIGDSFNCFKNGRPDSDFLKFRWKPHGCQIPRFSGANLLKILNGKRLVFVGDSLNRNMFQSMVCSLRESLYNKSKVIQVSVPRDFRAQGHYSFRFIDYNVSIDFAMSPFLVQRSKIKDNDVLRLDTIDKSSSYYKDSDIIIFNTGGWWTHTKLKEGNDIFMEDGKVYKKLEVKDAHTKALKTWARWIDSNIDPKKTKIFYRGLSASHFKGGQWNSGGNCNGEKKPITNETYLSRYPWMMETLESVISEMKTPVVYMNVTKMTDFRKDGHPSVFREVQDSGAVQDCSHWCLPGIPDSWNQLLYANMLASYYKSAA